MTSEVGIASFTDNWSYLKAELAWLDRVLMRAMAKQRQTDRDVDRVARSSADKASSHWWRGFMTIDPAKGGSMVRSDTATGSSHPLGRYGDRVASSLSQGIHLSLPILVQHLELTTFERDIILLCIAPEISRRYDKLYAVLNHDNDCYQPTVDLGLRLFCHSDAEWRMARSRLLPNAPLIKSKLLEIHAGHTTSRSFLSRHLQLSDKLVNYLLSDEIPLSDTLPKTRKRR